MTTSRHSSKGKHRHESGEFTIKGAPAKAFFVWMITRDIELRDAILDLLDNCIDGIKRKGVQKDSPTPYKGHYAKISFDATRFTIEDNCGGISKEIAEEYAFRMGRPDKQKADHDETVGVYGIGMKRAIFKLGRRCVVHSFTGHSAFDIEITPEWLENDDQSSGWDLKAKVVDPKLTKPGVRIEVTELYDNISDQFDKGSSFHKLFEHDITDTFSFIIAKGFKVFVNDKEVSGVNMPHLLWQEPSNLRKKEQIRPYVYTGKFENVSVFLAVGFREPNLPGEEDDEQRYKADEAGWTIICNDRIVVYCDKTKLTGWGPPHTPNFHNQFIGISGYVEMRSKDPRDLPMTTTKRGIDASSPVYLTIRDRMIEGLKIFTRFTNVWKGFEEAPRKMLSSAKALPLSELRVVAKNLDFSRVRADQNQKYSIPTLPERKKEVSERRISFVKPLKEIDQVAEYLFDSTEVSPSDVGEKCFTKILKEARK